MKQRRKLRRKKKMESSIIWIWILAIISIICFPPQPLEKEKIANLIQLLFIYTFYETISFFLSHINRNRSMRDIFNEYPILDNVILTPIREEAIFRNLLLNILIKINFNTSLSILIVSVIFMMFHTNIYSLKNKEKFYLIFDILIAGILLGYCYANLGFVSAIILHSYMNMFTYIRAKWIQLIGRRGRRRNR
ncbi:MAG: lysostaphin resistance A-like protein [Promethearchaeota archaeon]